MPDNSAKPSDSFSRESFADAASPIPEQPSLAYESRNLKSLQTISTRRIVAGILWLCSAAAIPFFMGPQLQYLLVSGREGIFESLPGIVLATGLGAHALVQIMLGIGCFRKGTKSQRFTRHLAPAYALFMLIAAVQILLNALIVRVRYSWQLEILYFLPDLGRYVLLCAGYGLLCFIHFHPIPIQYPSIDQRNSTNNSSASTVRWLLALCSFHAIFLCIQSSTREDFQEMSEMVPIHAIAWITAGLSLTLTAGLMTKRFRLLILLQAIGLYGIALVRTIAEPRLFQWYNASENLVPAMAATSLCLLYAHVHYFRMTAPKALNTSFTPQPATPPAESTQLAPKARWVAPLCASLWLMMAMIFLLHGLVSLAFYRSTYDDILSTNRLIDSGKGGMNSYRQPLGLSGSLAIMDNYLPSIFVGLGLGWLGVGLVLGKPWASRIARLILPPMALLFVAGLIAWSCRAFDGDLYLQWSDDITYLMEIFVPWLLMLSLLLLMYLHYFQYPRPVTGTGGSRLPIASQHWITWLCFFSMTGFSLRVLVNPWLSATNNLPWMARMQLAGHGLVALAIYLIIRNPRAGRRVCLGASLLWISYGIIGLTSGHLDNYFPYGYRRNVPMYPLIGGPIPFVTPELPFAG